MRILAGIFPVPLVFTVHPDVVKFVALVLLSCGYSV